MNFTTRSIEKKEQAKIVASGLISESIPEGFNVRYDTIEGWIFTVSEMGANLIDYWLAP